MPKFEPIPDFAKMPFTAQDYAAGNMMNTDHRLHNDPLVDLREPEFGFLDASSRFARPQPDWGYDKVIVPDVPLVRHDVAKRLREADELLRTDADVRDALGGSVRLKVEDAVRPRVLQALLDFQRYWPTYRDMYVGVTTDSADEAKAKRQRAAEACVDFVGSLEPDPHVTGGVVDVAMVSLVTDEAVDMGCVQHSALTAQAAFFEEYSERDPFVVGEKQRLSASEGYDESQFKLRRRVLNWAMTEAGLYISPDEVWHFGRGDRLSMSLSEDRHPYYDVAELPDWYVEEMQRLQP